MAAIALGSFACVFCLAFGALLWARSTRIRVDQRVVSLATGQDMPTARPKRVKAVRRPRSSGDRKPLGQQLAAHLQAGDISLDVRSFVVRWVACTLCLMLVLILVSGFLAAIVGMVMSLIGTMVYIRSRIKRRVNRFNDDLVDLLTLIVNSLRAGYSFVQALHTVGQDMQGPVQEEFHRIEAEMQVGVGLEEALQRADARIQSEDFSLIVTAVSIQRQVGGNLAEVLDKIAETIRDRVKLQREVRALTSQGRLSATIFMVLPIGVGVLLFIMNPGYVMVMFQNPIGWIMLLIAALGQGIGYFFIRKIVKVEL